MIVADTNLIAYLVIRSQFTSDAVGVLLTDDEWIAPPLWRSEFRNVLSLHVRHSGMPLRKAIGIARDAERVVKDWEGELDSAEILRLADETGCAAYDCEFAAVAVASGCPLVTNDRKVLAAFPGTAVGIADFAAGSG